MKFGSHKPATRQMLIWHLFMLPALVCLGVLPFAAPLRAADTIAAYLDSNGRVVFVNDGDQPAARKSSKTQPRASSDRRLVASTTATPSLTSREPASIQDTGVNAEQRLVTPSTPDAAATLAPSAASYDELIQQAASRHQIDPELVRAIIQVESNFDPYAVSPAGARGLMQLIPATAARFGVANIFDPRANIDGGVRYLKYLLGMYGGDLRLSLAAYNAGENSVARFGGVPAFRETQDYIRRIEQIYPMRTIVVGVTQEPQIVKFVDEFGVVHFSNTDLP
jgi:soluble lytic murein transglycosylase-like protein